MDAFDWSTTLHPGENNDSSVHDTLTRIITDVTTNPDKYLDKRTNYPFHQEGVDFSYIVDLDNPFFESHPFLSITAETANREVVQRSNMFILSTEPKELEKDFDSTVTKLRNFVEIESLKNRFS